MRVEDKQTVKGTDTAPAKSATGRTLVRAQADKVSIDGAKQVDAVVQAVRTSVGADRSARLQELETAIRQGGYQPDAGQLAEKIVQAAEVDARLSVIFGG
ncbi:MAG TPA: flagellar biosynthesis anti-sigma factor FlgM [Polyangia bacterium]|jgi:anti-sigma28 factor (negative regulator of flagellin synthesis)